MATYYLTISPINKLSTSTYSIYFDSIAPSNLITSGVLQSTLTGAGYPVDNTGRTSIIVKNEDPDCCCDAQSFVFPTPSPTATPTTTPTSQPTTATPTTQPTTATPTTQPTTPNPTTPNPTTPNPTTPHPTAATCGYFGVPFEKVSGAGSLTGNSASQTINGGVTSGHTYIAGLLTTTCPNTVIRLRALSGSGGSYSQGTVNIVNVLGAPSGNYSSVTALVGPGGGLLDTKDVIIANVGTYDVTLDGFFNAGTNPPSSVNQVWITVELP
jgi:hypothetical protein